MMRSGFETGYALNPIQRLAANATSTHWVDAVVVSAADDGWIELALLDTDAVTRIWHHTNIDVVAGEPVSLHERYSVLAAGREQFSVRVA